MDTPSNPEIGLSINAAGIETNYHDQGEGPPVLLLHGSGPGVSAWANWRLTLPPLAESRRVIAPDVVGFGFTERPEGIEYTPEQWVRHAVGFLDALGLDQVDLVGNSFGGGLALRLAQEHPARVRKLVLMGAVSLSFPLTEGLDSVWGYEPSSENMRALIKLFAYDQSLASDDLAELRHRASTRPGVQEAYAAMFPAPRQRWVDMLASTEEALAALPNETLIVHGRDDRVIPVEVSERAFRLIDRAQLHLFGRCGHWVQIEHAQRFNRLLADFLAE
ncbi:alpha/beta fold hydrolase [Arhodomonas sp. SL1]|uniref:alpha/beta fold hydrolase n=1 Tax=Arhodomonas sp. SL1 TaxID=3425691 RepID=UPI003F885756